MASQPVHDDETMPEETQGYKLSQPKQSLAEYQQMGELDSIFLFLCFVGEEPKWDSVREPWGCSVELPAMGKLW
ncbi:hypothetical protein ACHAQH_008301 [Verticillium albo-atrum]